MNTSDFDSSKFYADTLRRKIQSVKKQEEEKEQRIADVTSAFQYLSSTVMGFYREADLGVLIDCDEKVLECELEKTNHYDNTPPIKCQVTTLHFSRDYVSVILAPNDNKITSGFASSKNTLISFILEAKQGVRMTQDHKGTMNPDDSYNPSPNEQYILRYTKGDGWSVNIHPRNSSRKSPPEVKFFDEPLTAESFLRIMSSFFSPVIK